MLMCILVWGFFLYNGPVLLDSIRGSLQRALFNRLSLKSVGLGHSGFFGGGSRRFPGKTITFFPYNSIQKWCNDYMCYYTGNPITRIEVCLFKNVRFFMQVLYILLGSFFYFSLITTLGLWSVTCFGCHKNGWECPELPLKKQLKMARLLMKNSFGCHKISFRILFIRLVN